MEETLVKCQQIVDTRFSSERKGTDTGIGVGFQVQKHDEVFGNRPVSNDTLNPFEGSCVQYDSRKVNAHTCTDRLRTR